MIIGFEGSENINRPIRDDYQPLENVHGQNKTSIDLGIERIINTAHVGIRTRIAFPGLHRIFLSSKKRCKDTEASASASTLPVAPSMATLQNYIKRPLTFKCLNCHAHVANNATICNTLYHTAFEFVASLKFLKSASLSL